MNKPKPIHRPRFGIISRPNVPYSSPLTPGLNRTTTNAIGFLAPIVSREQSDAFVEQFMRGDQALKG